MKPRFILNSFTRQLYNEEDDRRKVIPLIEPSEMDQYIGYEPNFRGCNGNDTNKNSNNMIRVNEDKDYWTLRHNNEIEKIQRLKDAKVVKEIKSMKDKPDINNKSKKIIDNEYKEVDVLKRMKMMHRKTIEKKKVQKENEYKGNTKKMNSNKQYRFIQSKYKNQTNLRQVNINNDLKNNNEGNDIVNPKNNNTNTSIPVKYDVNIQNEDIRRKKDLNNLITFMNQLI